jgi:hypothetical protein
MIEPNPERSPPTGLSTSESSAMLYLLIILKTGFCLFTWTTGFLISWLFVVLNSLKPSSGMRLLVYCLGLRLYVPRGAGMPVDDKQLIAASCSRRYKRLGWGMYNAFIWVELVSLFVDKSVFVPVF